MHSSQVRGLHHTCLHRWLLRERHSERGRTTNIGCTTNGVGCAHARQTARANAPAPETSEAALDPLTSTMEPRRWVTRSAVTASPSCRRRQPSRPPRQYLAAAWAACFQHGRLSMLTSIMHCMHGKKWTLCRIVSCARLCSSSRRLLRFECFRCSAPLRHHRQDNHAAGFLRDDDSFWPLARRCAAIQEWKSTMVHWYTIKHPPVPVFLWRTSRQWPGYWAEY